MRINLIEAMKLNIENNLKAYLREEGLELYVAANDNIDTNHPAVFLKKIENSTLNGSKLLFEIRIMLELMGKPWQCDGLVEGIYQALQPYNITLNELTVLLISLHVETLPYDRPRKIRKAALMKYIVEANP